MTNNNQPVGRLPPVPNSIFRAGARRSVGRLKQLGFDPIGELVDKYRKLEQELEHQEKIRSGEVQEMTASGKIRAYRPEIHHAIYDRLLSVSKELLRYGYGRVPENDAPQLQAPPAFVVNLTKKGETYVVADNEGPPPDMSEDEDFGDD